MSGVARAALVPAARVRTGRNRGSIVHRYTRSTSTSSSGLGPPIPRRRGACPLAAPAARPAAASTAPSQWSSRDLSAPRRTSTATAAAASGTGTSSPSNEADVGLSLSADVDTAWGPDTDEAAAAAAEDSAMRQRAALATLSLVSAATACCSFGAPAAWAASDGRHSRSRLREKEERNDRYEAGAYTRSLLRST